MMMRFFAALTALLALAPAAEASPCSPWLGECSYYRCLSAQQSCGEREMIPRVALTYCERYHDNEAAFTPHGRRFLNDVRRCLQEKIEAAAPATCARSSEVFQDVHFDCYLETGYCDLSWGDRGRIAWIGRRMLVGTDFFWTGRRIEAACHDSRRRSSSDWNSLGLR
ncbi:MAG: hypothetical protein KF802_03910 [Bdellovibrionaceae bacterium]|nr:hypothetical protein [Pseudobdellovibrionaceae bacterium]